MRSAKSWAKLIDSKEFVPTEELMAAVQRDVLEHAARTVETRRATVALERQVAGELYGELEALSWAVAELRRQKPPL